MQLLKENQMVNSWFSRWFLDLEKQSSVIVRKYMPHIALISVKVNVLSIKQSYTQSWRIL